MWLEHGGDNVIGGDLLFGDDLSHLDCFVRFPELTWL